jgi:asparagine synthase (glutamine-hydrolysing)
VRAYGAANAFTPPAARQPVELRGTEYASGGSNMCGIAGIAPRDRAATPDNLVLRRMIEAVHHRGPDGYGFHRGPGIGLAHARLAIIDLFAGAQPIHNEDGSVWVIFNGEIFNYIELRAKLKSAGHQFYTASDTEVIVHAYEQYDLDFVQHLNGQFAIALWDSRRDRLVLARDRVGIRPLLYAETAQGLAFASEAKSLFAGGCLTPRLDLAGVAEVSTFWGCLAPRTAFAGVQALQPGHLAVYECSPLLGLGFRRRGAE